MTIWEENAKLRFKSKYTNPGKRITASQYLAEFICERIAVRDKSNLTIKFWNNPDWTTIYKHQITQATRLLRLYPLTQILSVLRRLPNVYSLGNKTTILRELHKQAQKLTKLGNTTTLLVEPSGQLRPKYNKSLLDKLEE